jgi:Ca-activated chloride channel family protein
MNTSDMQFQYPGGFLWIIALAILFVLFILRERTIARYLDRVADQSLLETLLPNQQRLNHRRRARDILILLSGFAFLIALARPQWGFTWQESVKRGVDIVVAVDVSHSMLAEDIKPSRLVRAQREVMDLLDQLKGDRVGLVSFAGTAYLESPLTLDYSAFRGFLQSLSPELIPIQGTNIEAAIRISIEALKQRNKGLVSTNRSNVIVLITDGENFEGDIESAGKIASDEHIKIYIIGVGTANGAPIPGRSGYRRDDSGELVLTKLHESSLRKLAKATGGTYVSSITSDQDTFSIYEEGIRKSFEGSELDYMKAKTWNEYFQIPLGIAILLLLLGPWGNIWKIAVGYLRSSETKTAVLLLLLASNLVASPKIAQADELSDDFKRRFNSGSTALGRGDFQTALEQFSKLRQDYPDNLQVLNAEAISHYRLQEFEQAENILKEGLKLGGDKQQMAEILYNLGNTAVQRGKYQEAVSHYESSLNLQADEEETIQNLEYAKKLIEKQEEENKDQQQDDEKKESQKDEQKDKNKQKNEENKEQKDKNKQDSKAQNDQQNEQNNDDSQEQDSKKSPESEGGEGREEDTQEKNESESEPEKEKDEKPADENKSDSEESAAANEPEQSTDSDEDNGSSEVNAELSEQLEAQLENVEERNGSRMKFRIRKGIQQLDKYNMPAPDKDW